MKSRALLLLALLLCALISSGLGNPMLQAARRKRTTTNDQDMQLAQAAAALTAPSAAEATASNALETAQLLGQVPEPATVPTAPTITPGSDPAAATDAAATAATAAAAAAAVAVTCPSGQFQWPAGSGYCWYKRDSANKQQGPGNNIFKPVNVAVNTADQLVLTIDNQGGKVATSSCAEVFLNKSYGYGDYIFVVATNPTAIDIRLVGAPFIYANDTQEFDFEFSKWNTASDPNNSQFMVQPYNPNYPVRYPINAVNTTHRMRWTPQSVVFESYKPTSAGGGLINTYTYTGVWNFVPGPELVHINYWINTRQNSIPKLSNFITNCFKFCSSANFTACSTPLGTKPRCSNTKTW